MNIAAAVKELSKTLGTPRPRAAFGSLIPYAWLVRGLVEKGFGVSDSVHHVINNSGLADSKQTFGSVRAAYYKIREVEWPVEHAAPGTTEEEGFE